MLGSVVLSRQKPALGFRDMPALDDAGDVHGDRGEPAGAGPVVHRLPTVDEPAGPVA
jgi:hypothetical protein